MLTDAYRAARAGRAAAVLVAGDGGVGKTRLVEELATHARRDGAVVLTGSAVDIEIQADDLRHTRDTVLGLIAEHTGQDRETVERDSRRDRWFSAEDALAYGFVDQVISSVDHVTPGRQRPVGLAGVR